ncbi:hypothetical protein PDE_08170 [Penicillium oxalicum 114-2]|uniref:HORMA domain-containing protein n=1 Tax=Penicillium oxalicum (strain 114-2 / CGMCC 5302) TaxID=933388 RepID=S8B2Z4_PENO1|nr:hypothetical protein PDE_08170 [Penicillium oxalicum 114-2]
MVPRLILKCPPPPSAESEERKPSKVLKVTLKVPPKRTCLQVAVKKDASINSGQISSRISKKESASRRKSLLKRYQEQALDSFQNDAPLSTHNNKPIPVNVFNYPEVVSRSSSDLAKLQARIEAYNAEEQEILPLTSFESRDLPTCSDGNGFCYEEHFMRRSQQINVKKVFPFQLRDGRAMVLKRNVDQQTDDLLDCLEGDIMSHLTKRQLIGLQLWVCESLENRLTIHETYCISVGSSRNASSRLQCPPLDGRSETMEPLVPKNLKDMLTMVGEDISGMVRRLTVMTSRLGSPSENRKLVLHCFLEKSVPRRCVEYGLHSWSDQPICNWKSHDWRRETLDCGFADTGFYTYAQNVLLPDYTMSIG